MSYFSDIDLATLHQSRLNERIQYKLSWSNRRHKYYIPSTEKQSNNRHNQKHCIKTGGNNTFTAAHKQFANNANKFLNDKSSLANGNNNKKPNKNQQKNASRISNAATSIINHFSKKFNHCDNLTEDDCVYSNKTRTQKANQSNDITNAINNVVNNVEKQQRLTDTHVSLSSVSLASDDLDSTKNGVGKHSMMYSKCLSGDAISKHTQTMTDKTTATTTTKTITTNDIHNLKNQVTVSDQTIQEDLNVPHRKRSGTWP